MQTCLVCVLAALLLVQASATAQGAIKLDNMTFDKVVSLPGHSLLVKFDKSYAYGEKEDAFKELCKLAYPVKDFLVAEVPVQEYGDKENDDLRERFEVKADDFPVYFFFKGSADAKTRFEGFPDPSAKKPSNWDADEDGPWEPPMKGEPTAENLAQWLRIQGIKMPSVGTIAELDEVVEQFMKGGASDSDLSKAEKLAAEDHKNDAKAPIYVRIMKKIKEKGTDYIATEKLRVQKLLGGKLTPEKKTEMSDKMKILNVFANVEL